MRSIRTALPLLLILSAAETGFADASHLIRTFRAESGQTPDAWRKARRRAASPDTLPDEPSDALAGLP